MELANKILFSYIIIAIILIAISSQEWTPIINNYIKVIVIIFFILIIIINIYILFNRNNLILKIILTISSLVLFFPFFFSIVNVGFTKKYIKTIDDFYFYKTEAFPSPGEELAVFKKNKYLPIIKRFSLKYTFNIEDKIHIYKKNDTIFIDRTFIDEVEYYYLDTNEHRIKGIKNE